VSLEPIKPLIGQSWKLPLGIAPSAMQQLAHPLGEKASAAAAKAMNVPFALSTFSNNTIEDVREVGGSCASFFQIYLFGGEREGNIEHLKRAKGIMQLLRLIQMFYKCVCMMLIVYLVKLLATKLLS